MKRISLVLALALSGAPALLGVCIECTSSWSCGTKPDGGCTCAVISDTIPRGIITRCESRGWCATIGPTLCPGDPGYTEKGTVENLSNSCKGSVPLSAGEVVDLVAAKQEPYTARTTYLPKLDLESRSIDIPEDRVSDLLAKHSEDKRLEALVWLIDSSNWSLASDISSLMFGLADTEGEMVMDYSMESLEILDNGIRMVIRDRLQKSLFEATLDWTDRLEKDGLPVDYTVVDLPQ